MGYSRVHTPLRERIPTVLVRLSTDEGEVVFRARWDRSALELQRMILYWMRSGRPLWFRDEWGHDVCFRPDRVWGAMVDGTGHKGHPPANNGRQPTAPRRDRR